MWAVVLAKSGTRGAIRLVVRIASGSERAGLPGRPPPQAGLAVERVLLQSTRRITRRNRLDDIPLLVG